MARMSGSRHFHISLEGTQNCMCINSQIKNQITSKNLSHRYIGKEKGNKLYMYKAIHCHTSICHSKRPETTKMSIYRGPIEKKKITHRCKRVLRSCNKGMGEISISCYGVNDRVYSQVKEKQRENSVYRMFPFV